jgi:CAAX protease family protein
MGLTSAFLQVCGVVGTGNVLPMTDTEAGGAAPGPIGPPSRPPGPVPAGFVPAEWMLRAPPPPPTVQSPPPPPSVDIPFLDTPWVPPQTKRQGWMWIVYAVAGFVVGQLGAVLFAFVAALAAGKTSAQLQAITTSSVPPEWYVVSTLLGLWVGFIGAPWLASRTQGTRHFLRDLGVRFRWWDLMGILIGIGGQILVGLMYLPFQHDIHNFNAPSQRLTGASHGGGFIVIAVATVLFAPAMEELFFRGLLLKGLVRVMTPLGAAGRARTAGVVLAVVADGLLFGLAHGEWVQLAGLAMFGIVLAGISYRTGRLGMNMVAHASFNLVAIISIAANGSVLFH